MKAVFFLLSWGGLLMAADKDILVIGHRGACGYLPEHTLESYKLAIEKGADFIEPDLVMSKDGHLVVRHENELSATTDVSEKYPSRKAKKTVDGVEIEGWFSEDFTLAELKTLKAKQAMPERDATKNGQFEIPTFEEVLKLARDEGTRTGKRIGVYPETKHPTYFSQKRLPMDDKLLAMLKKYGYGTGKDPVFIQSFETGNLRVFREKSTIRLIQLLDEPGKQPFDLVVLKRKTTYADMMKPSGLKEIKKYATGIGPWKRAILPEGPDGKLQPASSLISDAHAVGLLVHPYTFRSDSKYLAAEYQGNPKAEYEQFFQLGVDGVFSDFPDVAVEARKAWQEKAKAPAGK